MAKIKGYRAILKEKQRLQNLNVIQRDIIDGFFENIEYKKWSEEFKKNNMYVVALYPRGRYLTQVVYKGIQKFIMFYKVEQIEETLNNLTTGFEKYLKKAKN